MESNPMTPAIGGYNTYGGRGKGVNGFVLKLIAVVSMMIDHWAATFIERQFLEGRSLWVTPENMQTWYDIDFALRCVGRMAFPLYIFLLVEGFAHTRNLKKYMLNMAIFVVLSEIPFDLAFNLTPFDWYSNSVFVTLLIGLLMISALRWVDDHLTSDKPSIPKYFLKSLIMVVIIMAMMLLANFLHTDYAAGGVAAIAIMYLLRNYRLVGFAVMVIMLGFMCGNIEWYALLMLVPVYFYNGKRGPSGKGVKYFFYAFYPVHLLLYALICMGLGI